MCGAKNTSSSKSQYELDRELAKQMAEKQDDGSAGVSELCVVVALIGAKMYAFGGQPGGRSKKKKEEEEEPFVDVDDVLVAKSDIWAGGPLSVLSALYEYVSYRLVTCLTHCLVCDKVRR